MPLIQYYNGILVERGKMALEVECKEDGNSWLIRIPKDNLRAADIKPGDIVIIEQHGGTISIRKKK